METLTVTERGQEKTTKSGEKYWAAKAGGTLYYFDKPVEVGDVLQCEIKESTYTNRQGGSMISRWAKIKGKASAQQTESSKAQLNQFIFAEAVDFYWDKIKQWEMADDAKASVLCTCLIATADGRVNYELPPDEPESDPFE